MENDPPQPAEDDLLEQLRDMPVGVNDPNIIGDAGPTDVPPGTDPPSAARAPAATGEVTEEEPPPGSYPPTNPDHGAMSE
ncbi:MAG: hypothetical protein M3404_03140 [Actinomycetota bacterium]|nr:hypothetical protein [Actinomycetota bacterium]